MGFWEGGGKQRPSRWKLAIAHAECLHGPWVDALSRGAASDVPGSTGKPEPAFQSAESTLPVQNRPISGACAVLAPHEVRGGILVGVLGSFGPSPHGELPSRVSIRHPGPDRVGASRMAARARREKCSGRIGTSLPRRGPRRPKCPVVLSQSYRVHPAAATVRG